MIEAPAQVYRISPPGPAQALTAVAPDSETDPAILLDWCVSHGHNFTGSLPFFPLVRDVAPSPDLHVDALLLTETGALVAVLVDCDPPASVAPTVGAVVSLAQWCSSLRYDDLEELFNADRADAASLHAAYREHFAASSRTCPMPSGLNRSHAIWLILPQEAGARLNEVLDYVSERTIPVVCLKYSCFRAESDTVLVVWPQEESAALGAHAETTAVDTEVIGDVSGVVRPGKLQPAEADATAPTSVLASRHAGDDKL